MADFLTAAAQTITELKAFSQTVDAARGPTTALATATEASFQEVDGQVNATTLQTQTIVSSLSKLTQQTTAEIAALQADVGKLTTSSQEADRKIIQQHQNSSQKIAQLSGSLTRLQDEVKAMEQVANTSLQHFQDRCDQALRSVASSLGTLESRLSTNFVPRCKNLAQHIGEIGGAHEKFVREQILPRIQSDRKRLLSGLEHLRAQVEKTMTSADHHAKATLPNLSGHFKTLTGTAWKPGSGGDHDVLQAARTRGHDLEQKIEQQRGHAQKQIQKLQQMVSHLGEVSHHADETFGRVLRASDAIKKLFW